MIGCGSRRNGIVIQGIGFLSQNPLNPPCFLIDHLRQQLIPPQMTVFRKGIKQKLTGSFVQLIIVGIAIVVVMLWCGRRQTTPVHVSTGHPFPKGWIVALHEGLQIQMPQTGGTGGACQKGDSGRHGLRHGGTKVQQEGGAPFGILGRRRRRRIIIIICIGILTVEWLFGSRRLNQLNANEWRQCLPGIPFRYQAQIVFVVIARTGYRQEQDERKGSQKPGFDPQSSSFHLRNVLLHLHPLSSLYVQLRGKMGFPALQCFDLLFDGL